MNLQIEQHKVGKMNTMLTAYNNTLVIVLRITNDAKTFWQNSTGINKIVPFKINTVTITFL